MSTATPATRFLQQAKVPFRVIEYDYDPGHERVALQAAEAIGIPPGQMFKTLMIEVDKQAACVVIPGDRTLSMKRAAAAFGGKSAAMMPADKAERATGYHTGGISPFGQRRRVPVIVDISAMDFDEVAINGGKRGLVVVLPPKEAAAALDAKALPLCAED